ncbi:MAG TPA: DUF1501 domain-containing protein [Pirellulaceae bacterium]|nr:DUF1501 domain-containing protein [Pirellulaceae bacterium]
MLTILGPTGRLCDRPSRRELLTVGGLSLLGWSLPQLLAREAAAQEKPATSAAGGFGKADSVILIHLQGSPSHIDLWDPKPDAPAEIRGEFKPIATTAPGMMVGEVLPQLAQQAKNFALVRSIGVDPKGLRNHGAAIYMLLTGHNPLNFSPTGLAVPPSREDLPSVGAVVAKYRPAERGTFSNVAVCGPVLEGGQIGVAQGAGLLGPAMDPFRMYGDPTQPLKLEAYTLPGDVTLDRLQSRVDLRSQLDAYVGRSFQADHDGPKGPSYGATFATKGLGPFFDQALSLLQSGRAIRAFQLDQERSELRERYGMTKFGQSCLLARRLVEAGVRFVQITWPAGSDAEPAPGPDGSWDTHRNNFPTLRNDRCPVFDKSLSALIEDMAARGILEKTLVIAIGEFGRSPKIGSPTTDNVGPGGRDHWPECYSFLIAGGGVRGGQVYGESDRHGAWPKTDKVHPYDVVATIHHALGIDPQTEYHDTLNRPRRLVERGKPIVGLF